MPLAPPGIKVLVHEQAIERGTFDLHTIPGWYLGPTMNHYCCFWDWIRETSSVRITDDVTWLPHNTLLPTTMTEYLIVASANDLTTALLHHKPTNLLPPMNTEMYKALLQLSTIFVNWVHPTDAHLISTPIQEQPPITKNTTPVPRVRPTKQTALVGPKSKIQTTKRPYLPPANTSEYLKHNSLWQQLQWQNRAAISATICGLALKRQLVASINMIIEINNHNSHHSTHRLNAGLDTESRKVLEYCHLLKTKHKEIWSNACSKEFAHQGQAQDYTPFTNTIFFIAPHEPPTAGKKPTYLCICADFWPQKKDPYCIRFTIGGNLIEYNG